MTNASDRSLKFIWSLRSFCLVTDWNLAWKSGLNESRYFTSTQFEIVNYSFRSLVGVVTARDAEKGWEREEDGENCYFYCRSLWFVYRHTSRVRKTERARDWIFNNFGWLLEKPLNLHRISWKWPLAVQICKHTYAYIRAHCAHTLGDSSTFECKWKASKVILRWPW